ncbi:MAG: hydrogenase iron-sulfur subunit [Armatimonadota bacterium]|nr:hydrogenase iron-sulfur subunit [Armatimonadota bacterium]MCX7777986.1 hydrogenase iron-sulfur subunit [Armatimonadota bacterium]MDW8026151.1 hydrogenase iron-sulfur subunit [Armatimonadota bacterium]
MAFPNKLSLSLTDAFGKLIQATVLHQLNVCVQTARCPNPTRLTQLNEAYRAWAILFVITVRMVSAEMTDERRQTYEPKIVALVCNWCTYAGADMAGTTRLQYPPSVRAIRLPCTGRIDPVFIIKAFEHGADAVLVSGCHPGDCHYLRGNYIARRRFITFRELMQFIGLQMERLQFSWVSASEGAKWAQLVTQITSEVASLGPMTAKWGEVHPDGAKQIELPKLSVERKLSPITKSSYEHMTGELRSLAKKLLGNGDVGVIIGYSMGRLGNIIPTFITSQDETELLMLNERCVHNLSVYLTNQLVTKFGRVGIVAKGCDIRAINVLIQENKLSREQVFVIGVDCNGVLLNGDVAFKCYSCAVRRPKFYDHLIESKTEVEQSIMPDPRDELVSFMESLSPDERWDFWMSQFAKCIRCYACRAACPMCYCEPCIAERNRPQWIPTTVDGKGNLTWNLVRSAHLIGRCVSCDECYRSCPMGIRLDLINRKLYNVVRQMFGYEAGFDAQVHPPLTTFREDDLAEFIR